MIVKSVSPTRISLFGGGTDLDIYSKRYGGLVISLAIDLYQHTTLYTEDDIWSISRNEFPPDADDLYYYHILDHFGLNGMHHSKHINRFEGLIEAGLGSSGAAAVALLGAIKKGFGKEMDIPELAYKLEMKHNYTGRQDHYASYYGGVNAIEFKDKVNVTPLAKGFIEPLLGNMVLFHTNIKRKKNPQDQMKTLTKEKIKLLDEIKELAVASIDHIASGDTEMVAQLLNYSWELKKKSNAVTSPEIDGIYKYALNNGALGGKLLGSGGGGYIMFIAKDKNYLIERMKEKNIENWDFNVDWNGLMVKEL
jgi:D-glycero-alpha-D-manno-heptose-7-phosphate kinase